jgi:hypothetical protein
MPVGTAGQNASTLASIETAWKGRSNAPNPPTDALEGTVVSFQANGDAATTAFTIPHNLKKADGTGITPRGYALTARNAVSDAPHWVSAVGTANVTVTFTTAPASGSNNVTFLLVAYK